MRLINISADNVLSSVESAAFRPGCDCRYMLPGAGTLLPSERGSYGAGEQSRSKKKDRDRSLMLPLTIDYLKHVLYHVPGNT